MTQQHCINPAINECDGWVVVPSVATNGAIIVIIMLRHVVPSVATNGAIIVIIMLRHVVPSVATNGAIIVIIK